MVGTVQAEATADMVAEAMADTVAEATADTVAEATADMVAEAMGDTVAAVMADTVAAAMADTATAEGMDIASALAMEAMAVTAMAGDTAGEDIPAVVITDMIAAIGAVAATTEAHIGAARYSALGSVMFREGRFATTRTGIRYRATCRHMTPTGIEWPDRDVRPTHIEERRLDRCEWHGAREARQRIERRRRAEWGRL